MTSLEDRNMQIVASYLSGLSLDEVGSEFDLSRERVRQILAELGVERRVRVGRLKDETLAAVAAVLAGNGEVSIDEASIAHGAEASGVGRYLRCHHPEFDYHTKRQEVIRQSVSHGTLNRYSNYGCRCVECREANAQSTVMVPVPVFDAMRDQVPSVRSWAIQVLREASGVSA